MRSPAALFLALRIAGRGRGGGREAGSWGGSGRHIRGALVGIALSLVPFVLVLLVADGMIGGISARYLETWSYHFQARSFGPASLGAGEEAAARLRALPGVLAAWPEIRGAALAVRGGDSAPALLRGLDAAALADPGMERYLRLLEGDRELRGREALVGSETAKALGLKVGDSLVVLTGTASAAGARTSILRVKGIVSAGYRDLDELWIFIPRDLADRILPAASREDLVGIKVAEPFAPPEAQLLRIEEALAPPGGSLAVSDWVVRPWRDLERNLFASFATTRALLLVIMGLSVLVAAANVSSALAMIVLERSRDIAILKATGASPAFVALVFLAAGGGTGLLGSLLGVSLGALAASRVNELIAALQALLDLLGALLARLGGGPARPLHLLDPAYYLERIPVRIDLGELGAVLALAFLLSLLASGIPALRASRLRPLEILRKS